MTRGATLSEAVSRLASLAQLLCREKLRPQLLVFPEPRGWDEYSYLAADEYVHKTLSYTALKLGAKYYRIDITALTQGPPRGANLAPPVCKGEECYRTVAELLGEATVRAGRYQPVVVTIPWLRLWLVDSRLLRLLDSNLPKALSTGCLLLAATSLEEREDAWTPPYFEKIIVEL